MQVAPTIAPDLQAPAPAAPANSTQAPGQDSFATHLQKAKASRSPRTASSSEQNTTATKTGTKGPKGKPATGQTATDGQENTAAAGVAAAGTSAIATAQPQAAQATGASASQAAETGPIGSMAISASTLKMLGLQPPTATTQNQATGQQPLASGAAPVTQATAMASQMVPPTVAQTVTPGIPTGQAMTASSQVVPPATTAEPTTTLFTVPGQMAAPNLGTGPSAEGNTGSGQTLFPTIDAPQAMPQQNAVDHQVANHTQTAAAPTGGAGASTATTPSGIPANVAAALGLSTLPGSQASSTPTMTDPASPAQTVAAQPQVAAAQQAIKGQDKVVQEAPVAPVSTEGGAAAPAQDGNRLNANDQYIHAHLPNKNAGSGTPDQDGHPAPDAALAGKQQETAHTGTNGSGATTTEQFVLQRQQAATAQDNSTTLQFHHQASSQPPTAPSGAGASNAPSSTSSFLLPSGASVPDNTVVNQMLDHLNLHKSLETSTVNIKLSPQELGELRMEIKVAQDNVKAHIIAQNPQAQEMIDRHLPRLREALAQQGLHLQQIEVSVGSYEHSGSDQFQQQTAWQHQGQSSHRSQGENASFVLPETTTDPIESTTVDSNALSVLA